jgi:glycosyltransferase involved in cell wall biosynthesis
LPIRLCWEQRFLNRGSLTRVSTSSQPLHICFICSEYPPSPHGGIGSFTQILGRSLVKRGFRVTAIGLYPEEDAQGHEYEVDQGVHVYRVSRRGMPLLRFLTNRTKLFKTIREIHAVQPIDVLEGGELDVYLAPSIGAVRVLRMHGGPTFFEVDSTTKRWKEKWSFRAADQLCAVSNSVAEGTRKMLGLGDQHIEVIYNPIETKLFAPTADALAEQDGLLVFAGTISERKGIRQLIQAMPRIVREVPNAVLEVYGGEVLPAPPRPLQQELAALLPPEMSSHVIWKGRVQRSVLPQAIQRASVCVYPSHFEAMPIAWLEGLASGKAVVASQTGPGREIIENGVNGLLCDPSNPDSIAAAVIRALKDKGLRKQLGEAARQRTQELYELEMIVGVNENYYHRLAGR